MKILFLVPYPLQRAPSQRFRFEQYFTVLQEKGFSFRVQSFLYSQNWQCFFSSGKYLLKLSLLLRGFFRRFKILFQLHAYDFVFIHREVSPVGPPVFEWLIANVFRKKIIYDFDDAIWLTDRSNESWVLKLLKWRSKVRSICKWSYRVSCGNAFLASYALRFNPRVVVNPTTIDTSYHLASDNGNTSQEIVIGWTGSYSTLKYLEEIETVLQRIEDRFVQVRISVIADRPPNLRLKKLSFIPWNAQTEISDLQKFDIGLMPLPDDEWSKGKCGFKLLQYFALGIPAIASRVGVNSQIVHDNESGFLCSTPDDWFKAMCVLIEQPERRKAFGAKGKKTVESHYSIASNASTFLSLFEK